MKSIIKADHPHRDNKKMIGNISLTEEQPAKTRSINDLSLSNSLPTMMECSQDLVATLNLFRARSKITKQLLQDATLAYSKLCRNLDEEYSVFQKTASLLIDHLIISTQEKVVVEAEKESLREDTTEMISLKVSLTSISSDANFLLEGILAELKRLSQSIEKDNLFDWMLERVEAHTMAFTTSYSNLYRMIENSELNQCTFDKPQTNIWYNEFMVYCYCKHLFKYTIAHYASEFASFGVKIRTVDDKIVKITKQLFGYCEKWLDQGSIKNLLEPLKRYSAIIPLEERMNIRPLMDPRYERLMDRVLSSDIYKGKKDHLVTFFEWYEIKLDRPNRLTEYFISCKIIELGKVISCMLVIDSFANLIILTCPEKPYEFYKDWHELPYHLKNIFAPATVKMVCEIKSLELQLHYREEESPEMLSLHLASAEEIIEVSKLYAKIKTAISPAPVV